MPYWNPQLLIREMRQIYREFTQHSLLLKKKQKDILKEYARELDRERMNQVRNSLKS